MKNEEHCPCFPSSSILYSLSSLSYNATINKGKHTSPALWVLANQTSPGFCSQWHLNPNFYSLVQVKARHLSFIPAKSLVPLFWSFLLVRFLPGWEKKAHFGSVSVCIMLKIQTYSGQSYLSKQEFTVSLHWIVALAIFRVASETGVIVRTAFESHWMLWAFDVGIQVGFWFWTEFCDTPIYLDSSPMLVPVGYGWKMFWPCKSLKLVVLLVVVSHVLTDFNQPIYGSSIFGAVSDAELKTKPTSIDVCSQVPAKTCPKIQQDHGCCFISMHQQITATLLHWTLGPSFSTSRCMAMCSTWIHWVPKDPEHWELFFLHRRQMSRKFEQYH